MLNNDEFLIKTLAQFHSRCYLASWFLFIPIECNGMFNIIDLYRIKLQFIINNRA